MAGSELSRSGEDYLETIYDLAQRGDGSVRSTDIANALGFSKASVARATKILREQGYITQRHYGEITLTKKGMTYGERILTRHRVLRAFLVDALGVDASVANDEACEMEHTVSEDTMNKWVAWYEKNYGPISEIPSNLR